MTYLIALGSSHLALVIFSLAILIVALIFIARIRCNLEDYRYVLKKGSGSLRGIGLIVALASVVALMSWTRYDVVAEEYALKDIEPADEEMHVIRTVHKKKVKKLPPPEKLIETVEEPLEEVKEPELIEEEVEAETMSGDEEDPNATEEPVLVKSKPLPLPIEPEEDLPEEIFVRTDQMPRFPGCEELGMTQEEKYVCAENELLKHIAKHLKYPSIAKENGIQGRVVLQFVIDKKGDVSDIKIVRDIGGGCGAAAADVIKGMVDKAGFWTPGKQRGRPVKVRYTLPVTFKLN